MLTRKPAFIVREGSATVPAYRYSSGRFCVAWYPHAGAKLKRETRPSEKAARIRAREIAIALANGRAEVLELSHADRDNYIYAKSLLGSTPLVIAIEQWHHARKFLPPGVSLSEAIADWRQRLFEDNAQLFRYNVVPPPRIAASRNRQLPRTSGVYFVWKMDRCVYVGRSANLRERCVIGKHKDIRSENEMLSWIEEVPIRLEIAEAYYIGALRPERNFTTLKAAPIDMTPDG